MVTSILFKITISPFDRPDEDGLSTITKKLFNADVEVPVIVPTEAEKFSLVGDGSVIVADPALKFIEVNTFRYVYFGNLLVMDIDASLMNC